MIQAIQREEFEKEMTGTLDNYVESWFDFRTFLAL